MMLKEPFVKIPETVTKGEVFSVKAKLKHPMETGWRENNLGQTVPRNRINKFVCTFNGKEMFRADLHSGISADPYLMFPARITESGNLRFIWYEDSGHQYVKNVEIQVN
jgi:sulfur-oxidizing protein SoxZ